MVGLALRIQVGSSWLEEVAADVEKQGLEDSCRATEPISEVLRHTEEASGWGNSGNLCTSL